MSQNLVFLLIASFIAATISAILKGLTVYSLAVIGYIIGMALGIVGLSIVVSLIPAGVYWLFKRRRMPGLTLLIWSLWGLATIAILF